eukprot:3417995-Amphidinium_carterae.1
MHFHSSRVRNQRLPRLDWVEHGASPPAGVNHGSFARSAAAAHEHVHGQRDDAPTVCPRARGDKKRSLEAARDLESRANALAIYERDKHARTADSS